MRSETTLFVCIVAPEGPLFGTSAPPEMASAIGAETFGLLFVGAESVGVEELGITVLTAVSACAEKNQKALARFGRRDTVKAITANPTMRSTKCSKIRYAFRFVPFGIESERWGLESIRNQVIQMVFHNTKMAYLSHFFHTSITAILSSISHL